MAVATGTQIRPELSAVDYTPFLQAASQSAQMQAQGIAALGAGVTKGFESFVQQQKENKQLEAEVKSAERLGNSLQFFLKDINPEAQAEFGKLMGGISDPNLSLRERAANSKNLGAALNSIIGLAQQGKKVQDEKAAAEYVGMLRMGGGQIPSPVSADALSRFTPQQTAAGRAAYLKEATDIAQLGQIQAKTELEKAQAKALLVPKAEKIPSVTQQIINSRVAAKMAELGRPLTARELEAEQITAIRATQPVQAPAFESEEAKETAKRYGDRMTKIETEIDDALRAEVAASKILAALDSGQTTGIFAPFTTFVSNILNLDDAAQKKLLEKGIAELSANQVTALARGLGSMSNADRDYFARVAPSITDSTASNRFYAEMAIQNAKFAQEDRDYINERMADRVGTQQIYIELQNRRKSRNVAESVYKKVMGVSGEAEEYLK